MMKILAIDGGGIKGLYSSTILEHASKKDLIVCFPIILIYCAALRLGGLTALAASHKIPMTQVSQFYQQEGPKMFPKQRILWLPRIFGNRISTGDIKQVLHKGEFTDTPSKKDFGN